MWHPGGSLGVARPLGSWSEGGSCQPGVRHQNAKAQGIFPHEAGIGAYAGPGGSVWPLWADPEATQEELRSGCGALGCSMR